MSHEDVESITALRQIVRPEWRLVRAVSVLERSLLEVDPSLRNADGKVVSIGEIVNEHYRDFFGDEIRNLNWALGIRNIVIHATGDSVTRTDIVRAGAHVIRALEVFAMSLDDELFGGLKGRLTGKQRNRQRSRRGARRKRSRKKRHWSKRRAPAVIARSRWVLVIPLILLVIVIALLLILSPSDPRDWIILDREGESSESTPDQKSKVEQALIQHAETKKQHARMHDIGLRHPRVLAAGGLLHEEWRTVCRRLGLSPQEKDVKTAVRKSPPLTLGPLPGDFPVPLVSGATSLLSRPHYQLLRGQHSVSTDALEVDRFRYFVYCLGQPDIMPRAERQGIVYDWENNLRPDREDGRVTLARLFRILCRTSLPDLPAGTTAEQSERWAEYNWARSRQPRHAFWYPSLIIELNSDDLSRALRAAASTEVL